MSLPGKAHGISLEESAASGSMKIAGRNWS
jgi:hypothetical protein